MTNPESQILLDMLREDGYSTATRGVIHQGKAAFYVEASKNGQRWRVI